MHHVRPANSPPPRTLARTLHLSDAVFIGMASMIGAGIFAAISPAAAAAGNWMLVSLGIAATVAFCNALSSAQLAALYPQSGGTYVYGRMRLGHFWGYLAGWGFVIGKVASCAAMALTFGYYVSGDYARGLAVAAVIAVTTVNALGVEKTAGLARVLVILVILALVPPVFAAFGADRVGVSTALPSGGAPGGRHLLEGAALLFFAFAGYARIATLGEEVIEPAKNIPRAIPIALALVLLVYAAVIASALFVLGPSGLASSAAPLVKVVQDAGWGRIAPVVRAGAALASLSVLLSLLAGVGRPSFAMARERDLPGWLDAVHPRFRVPQRAELVIGIVVVVLAATLDLRSAIGFSSFAVLFYYAIANASAWTLAGPERRFPRWVSVLGVAGCVALAVSLPVHTLIAGGVLFAIGAGVFAVRHAPFVRRPAA
jgi:APA family basic amino acid/polyamine antiporter